MNSQLASRLLFRLPGTSALILLAASPFSIAARLAAIWLSDWDRSLRIAAAVVLVGGWLGLAWYLRSRIVYSLRTLASLLEALQNEDYSLRAHRSHRNDSLDEVHREVNLLSERLSEQRLGSLEAAALLRTVIEEIELAVFAFDPEDRLRLVNRAGEKLLARPSSRLVGRTAGQLGLEWILEDDLPATVEHTFPGAVGRWNVRRTTFRQEGLPHRLLVLTDRLPSAALEERAVFGELALDGRLRPVRGALTPLHQACDLLAEHRGIELSMSTIPPDDPETYDDICRGARRAGRRPCEGG